MGYPARVRWKAGKELADLLQFVSEVGCGPTQRLAFGVLSVGGMDTLVHSGQQLLQLTGPKLQILSSLLQRADR